LPGDEDSPLQAKLGQFYVPIVLREFPDTPTLVNQEEFSDLDSACYQPITDEEKILASELHLNATECYKTKEGIYNPLSAATRWNYGFEYAMQVHRQQDEIHGKISFNIVDLDELVAMEAPQRDLFDNLAQFTQIYPKIRDDLNTYLVPIDVSTKDETTLKNAQFALESAAEMINWLADSASALASENEVLFASSTHSVDPIGFTISEGEKKRGNVDDALILTVTLTKELPPRVGRPLVEIEGYTCEIDTDEPKKRTFYYTKDSDEDSDNNYLPFSKAKTIPGRKFVLPDLDILERQDAQTEIYLTRNADIVPGKIIAKPFVYTTPTVSFESPLLPTLFNDDQINLATIFSTGKNEPVQRTLECQLTLFYEALFANAGTNDVTLQLSLYYEYSINPAIEKVRLPVYLMPPTKMAIRSGGSGESLTEIIMNQVKGWETWFNTHSPETKGGRLIFDLTVMSDLTAQPMPILRLRGLYLAVTDLKDSELGL
jgi:hypothetical protein